MIHFGSVLPIALTGRELNSQQISQVLGIPVRIVKGTIIVSTRYNSIKNYLRRKGKLSVEEGIWELSTSERIHIASMVDMVHLADYASVASHIPVVHAQ